MNGATQQEERLIQNLHDAGCSHEFVEQFLDKYTANNLLEQVRLLTEHRRTILNNVHKEQAKLECLDYLLFQIKKCQSLADVHRKPHHIIGEIS